MLAMVVNDDVGCLDARGVRSSIASKLAPTRAPQSLLVIFQTFKTRPPMATATSNTPIKPKAKLRLLPWAMKPMTAGPARIPA